MVVAAPHLVVGLYGPAWAHAVTPLQILCAVAVFRTIYHASSAVTHALGATSVAGSRWGIVGVVVGVAFSILYMYLAMASLVVSLTGCGWRAFFAVQLPGLIVAGLVAASALVTRLLLERTLGSSTLILLGIVAACGLTVPVAVYLLPHRVRPTDLFRRLDEVVERLPRGVRPSIRRVLRVPGLA
jgi:hypothetical protein